MTAKELKNALLQEAVQGKLVPQIASEGNARDLLEEIRKEKLSHGLDLRLEASLAINAKSGKRKSKKETALAGSNPCDITEDEIPFDIPENWCWCRLSDIGEINRGRSQHRPRNDISLYENGTIPFIQTGDVAKANGIILEPKIFYNEKGLSQSKLWKKGTICLTIAANIGDVAVLNFDACFPDSVVGFNGYEKVSDNKYVMYTLMWYKDLLDKLSHSTAQKNINLEILSKIAFPLPPLAEQKRIVAAIEKFMPLIEEYGKKETQLKAINEKIGTLTKKAILQEAVQGKLVPQIAAEGNARDLLEEIRKEKLSHGLDFANAKSGKKKSKKKTALAGSNPCDITEDEIPFDIPENWCWCKVGDLFSTMSGLGYKKDVLSEKSSKMVRVLRGGNILDTSYVFKDDDIMISDKYVKSELFLKKNYLITPAVTSLEHIGKIGYVEKDYDDTVVGGFVLMLLPYYSDEVLSKYCLYLFATCWFRDMCKEITHKSGQAFYNLSREKLLNLVIPIPPLAEQKRIVDALEKLLPLCEKIGE